MELDPPPPAAAAAAAATTPTTTMSPAAVASTDVMNSRMDKSADKDDDSIGYVSRNDD
jgi:hypothetical protein